ncbi:hypothetical protein THAR02_00976 [Trichoderma harzianum]|uniref:Uncharacterized protein n=1 Tax=Trichoderma harzianum TaxID=5544 RepID=A0A0F9XQW0_TRIHA|nr:hypothetical protein THAR02_00976 [Trichoderma harzianum]
MDTSTQLLDGKLLRREYGNIDWTHSLCAAPDCIGILGQCLLISFRPDLLSVKLEVDGLRYKTLFGNIGDIVQCGTETFRETGDKMRSIAFSSYELSKPGGIIERMYDFCQPEQDIGRDRQLRRCIQRSKEAIGECTAAIEEINNRFDKWSYMTKCLYQALIEAIANNATEAEIVESSIASTESELRIIEREQRRQEILLLESRHRLQAPQQWQRSSIEHAVAQGIFLAGSGLLSATTATMSSVGILLGAAAAVFSYSVLQTNTSNLENDQAEREARIDVMTEGATLLNTDLSRLFSKKRSIADVMKTIKDALYHVNQLQSQIRVFITHGGFGRSIDQGGKTILFSLPLLSEPQLRRVLQILLNDNFEIRARFVFASRASALYNNISTQYILPIIDRVDSLCLFHSETNDEIDRKLAELEDMKRKMVSATEECVIEMQEALKNDFDNMTRTAASQFDPVVEVAGEDVADSNDEIGSEYACH